MEGIERINIIMVTLQQRIGFRNLYAMDVDWESRNCYVCGSFGHIARNYRNKGVGMNRRMKVD